MKNANVVAALVSDKRREAGAGGDSIWPSSKPMDSLFSLFLRRRKSYFPINICHPVRKTTDEPLLQPPLSQSPCGIPRLPVSLMQAYVHELPHGWPLLVQFAVTGPRSGLAEMSLVQGE